MRLSHLAQIRVAAKSPDHRRTHCSGAFSPRLLHWSDPPFSRQCRRVHRTAPHKSDGVEGRRTQNSFVWARRRRRARRGAFHRFPPRVMPTRPGHFLFRPRRHFLGQEENSLTGSGKPLAEDGPPRSAGRERSRHLARPAAPGPAAAPRPGGEFSPRFPAPCQAPRPSRTGTPVRVGVCGGAGCFFVLPALYSGAWAVSRAGPARASRPSGGGPGWMCEHAWPGPPLRHPGTGWKAAPGLLPP